MIKCSGLVGICTARSIAADRPFAQIYQHNSKSVSTCPLLIGDSRMNALPKVLVSHRGTYHQRYPYTLCEVTSFEEAAICISHSHNTELPCAVPYRVHVYDSRGSPATYPVLRTRHSPLLIPDHKFEDCVLVMSPLIPPR